MPRSPSVSCSDLLKFRFQTQIILLADVCKKKSGFRNAIASGETKQSLDEIVDQKRKEKKIVGKEGGKKEGGVLLLNRQARKEEVAGGPQGFSFSNRNTSWGYELLVARREHDLHA